MYRIVGDTISYVYILEETHTNNYGYIGMNQPELTQTGFFFQRVPPGKKDQFLLLPILNWKGTPIKRGQFARFTQSKMEGHSTPEEGVISDYLLFLKSVKMMLHFEQLATAV